jgi:hypothetical protein
MRFGPAGTAESPGRKIDLILGYILGRSLV